MSFTACKVCPFPLCDKLHSVITSSRCLTGFSKVNFTTNLHHFWFAFLHICPKMLRILRSVLNLYQAYLMVTNEKINLYEHYRSQGSWFSTLYLRALPSSLS